MPFRTRKGAGANGAARAAVFGKVDMAWYMLGLVGGNKKLSGTDQILHKSTRRRLSMPMFLVISWTISNCMICSVEQKG